MTKQKLLAAVGGIVLLGLSAPVAIRAHEAANDLDRMTYVKFNRPVALPGISLGAGTYVFELPDPLGAYDIVRVSSQDRRTVYLTTFTRIVERPKGAKTGQPISFGEASASVPQPITAWWPSGESTGREFIY
jgi:hypothetical protein